jgi:signal peptidase
MSKAAQLGSRCWGLGAGLGSRFWRLGASENPPDPSAQRLAPSTSTQCAAHSTSPQHPVPSTQSPAPNWDTLGCELAAEVLRSWGRLRLRVVGASMLPALWPGDILSVGSQDAAEALPGDIVVFRREGRLVTHRVVEVRRQEPGTRGWGLGARENPPEPSAQPLAPSTQIEFVTRGDRVRRNDAPISSHELLGRVTAIERGARRLNPRQTFWSRIGASILSRSEFCTGLALKLGSSLVICGW